MRMAMCDSCLLGGRCAVDDALIELDAAVADVPTAVRALWDLFRTTGRWSPDLNGFDLVADCHHDRE